MTGRYGMLFESPIGKGTRQPDTSPQEKHRVARLGQVHGTEAVTDENQTGRSDYPNVPCAGPDRAVKDNTVIGWRKGDDSEVMQPIVAGDLIPSWREALERGHGGARSRHL